MYGLLVPLKVYFVLHQLLFPLFHFSLLRLLTPEIQERLLKALFPLFHVFFRVELFVVLINVFLQVIDIDLILDADVPEQRVFRFFVRKFSRDDPFIVLVMEEFVHIKIFQKKMAGDLVVLLEHLFA